MTTKETVQEALVRAQWKDVLTVCDVFSDVEILKKPLSKLKAHTEGLLQEDSAFSTADWTRLGVIVGTLWAKLDKIVSALQSGRGGNRSEQYLRDISMKLDRLVNEIRRIK